MSVAIAEPEVGGSGGAPCSVNKSSIKGWYLIIDECPYEPDLYWRLISHGHLEWTFPHWDLMGDMIHTGNYTQTGDMMQTGNYTQTGDHTITGNHYIDGFIELQPIPEPEKPLTGVRLFVDQSDNILKCKDKEGVTKKVFLLGDAPTMEMFNALVELIDTGACCTTNGCNG